MVGRRSSRDGRVVVEAVVADGAAVGDASAATRTASFPPACPVHSTSLVAVCEDGASPYWDCQNGQDGGGGSWTAFFGSAKAAAVGSSAHGRLVTGARTWSLEPRLAALPTPSGDHAISCLGRVINAGGKINNDAVIAVKGNTGREMYVWPRPWRRAVRGTKKRPRSQSARYRCSLVRAAGTSTSIHLSADSSHTPPPTGCREARTLSGLGALQSWGKRGS